MLTKLTGTNQGKSQARNGLKVKAGVKAGSLPINHNRQMLRST